jgi:D-sedoheptulose 7-phosphate isomerase
MSVMESSHFIEQELAESTRVIDAIRTTMLEPIRQGAEMMIEVLRQGSKILICGNGGSASDSAHFAAELVGRLQRDRRALPAIALTTDTAILTAVGNDYGFDKVFSKQVEGWGKAGDLLVAISTSGNSPNILEAVAAARQQGMQILALGGKSGGELARRADLALVMPSHSSQHIQEGHIAIIHIWCALIEDAFFPPDAK